MAKKVRWTAGAWNDLEETADFIAQDSPYYAAAFVREVKYAAQSLTKFARRGRIVPELNDSNIREIFVRDYRLIYIVSKSFVDILAFIHGSRDLPRHWH